MLTTGFERVASEVTDLEGGVGHFR